MIVEYSPRIFDVNDIQSAKRIILTPDDRSTDERWQTETPYLVDLLASKVVLNGYKTVMDYGCGIGRMSKALIERYDCRVIGVDISTSMRALATAYVGSKDFVAVHPDALGWAVPRCDVAIAVWALQHVNDLFASLEHLSGCVDGDLFVVNDHRRLVPSDHGRWIDDKIDLMAVLDIEFEPIERGKLDPGKVGKLLSDSSFWGHWKV